MIKRFHIVFDQLNISNEGEHGEKTHIKITILQSLLEDKKTDSKQEIFI